MCLKCHLNLSDELVKKDFENFKEEYFNMANRTSISHIIMGSSGFNGEEVRKIGIKLLERYDDWCKNNEEKRFGLNYKKIIKHLEDNVCKGGDIDDLHNYLENMNYLFI